MAVWTISAQEGSGGGRLAVELATVAGVPLLDRKTLAVFVHDLDPELEDADELEQRLGGRLNALALSLALSAGAAEAFHELQLRRTLPELGRAVLAAATRRPCVILAPGAFALLQDHPAAIHLRLRAPLAWRIANYQRDQLLDRHAAEKAVRHDDHLKRTWVRTLYRLDLDDPPLYALVADASRIRCDRLVEVLLAAGSLSARPDSDGAKRGEAVDV